MFLNILCVYVDKPTLDGILVDNCGVRSSLLGYSKTYHFLNHKDGCIIRFCNASSYIMYNKLKP